MNRDAHQMTLGQRFLAWELALIERILPILPRFSLRQRWRARVDDAQARLHLEVHPHHSPDDSHSCQQRQPDDR
jgi:hypothetical protein